MSAIDDPAEAEQTRTFSVGVALDADSAVVTPHGELDLATAPEVEQHVLPLWSEGVETVVLDLGGVSFFDSSALRLLMRLQARAAESGRALALRACSEPVQRVLELTRMHDRFTVVS